MPMIRVDRARPLTWPVQNPLVGRGGQGLPGLCGPLAQPRWLTQLRFFVRTDTWQLARPLSTAHADIN